MREYLALQAARANLYVASGHGAIPGSAPEPMTIDYVTMEMQMRPPAIKWSAGKGRGNDHNKGNKGVNFKGKDSGKGKDTIKDKDNVKGGKGAGIARGAQWSAKGAGSTVHAPQ